MAAVSEVCQSSTEQCQDVQVWDTQYAPRNKAHNIFLEAMSSFMPWSAQFEPMNEFEARIEAVVLESGAIAKLQTSPVERSRSIAEINNSDRKCIYGNFVLAGEMQVEQGGTVSVARPGDLVLYDSCVPAVVRGKFGENIECLQLMFDMSLFAMQYSQIGNIVVRRSRLICPIANTLRYLSDNLLAMPKAQISALFDALAKMLPVAISQSRLPTVRELDITECTKHMREVIDYIHANIRNTELSPATASRDVSLSRRHLHKLFSACGTTFSTYVSAIRLEEVARLLRSAERGDIPISALAHEFGFGDITTFNRAFRKRFGCAPREYRSTFN